MSAQLSDVFASAMAQGSAAHAFDLLDGAGAIAARFTFGSSADAEAARSLMAAALGTCRQIDTGEALALQSRYFGSQAEVVGDYDQKPLPLRLKARRDARRR